MIARLPDSGFASAVGTGLSKALVCMSVSSLPEDDHVQVA